MPTHFFTNSTQNTLFDKFKGIARHMPDLALFYAVVAYFRSSGYFALRRLLNDVRKIKILIGIDADKIMAKYYREGLIPFADNALTREKVLEWIRRDIAQARYSAEVEEGILQFVRDLLDGKVELRAHPTKKLHAKFYLFLPEEFNEHSTGSVIMGSSNISAAGLGLGNADKSEHNYELNVELRDYDDVLFAKEEFEKLWNESVEIIPESVSEVVKKTHLDKIFSPFELYIKFLIEYFGDRIPYNPETVGDLPPRFKKLAYQIDAVNQGYQMLRKHNGFFLADVVGLGKTVTAAMIAKKFILENGFRTRVLVVTPPTMRYNWQDTFKLFGLLSHTDFITNGSLKKILDNDNRDYPYGPEDYDLVIVDEAHKFRNADRDSFEQLQMIIKTPKIEEGKPPKDKKVILVSATPLNNRPDDLFNQLLLFQDMHNSTLEIPGHSLHAFFHPLIKRYRELIKRADALEKEPRENIRREELEKKLDEIKKEIKEIYEKIRHYVIAPITVRRTRKDIENYPKYKKDLEEQGIAFPEIARIRPVKYRLPEPLVELLGKTVKYLTDEINYYSYQAILHLNDEHRKQYERAVQAGLTLSGIMKTLMIKRLESSFFAFKKSLKSLITSAERLLDMFEKGEILIAPDLDLALLLQKGKSIEEIEEIIDDKNLDKKRNKKFKPEDFAPDYPDKLKKDLEYLHELYREWEQVDEDPKFDTFYRYFTDEFFRPDINPSGKLVVFTESNDTADYLYERLKNLTDKRIFKISAQNNKADFRKLMENFDANYEPEKQKNDIDVVIATDVLSEGINLHRANVLVNYDAPWNVTRLIQRLGRINRIGGTSTKIYPYIFYPSDEGDRYLDLYKRAFIRAQSFHVAFGEDARIFSPEEELEDFRLFDETEGTEEDPSLRYLQFIREFKEKYPERYEEIKAIPYKARSIRNAKNLSYKNGKIPGTVVFLKSARKHEFYWVDASTVKPLDFMGTVRIFEALAEEKAIPSLPSHHFEHVGRAMKAFREELQGPENPITAGSERDKATGQALRLLRKQLWQSRPEIFSHIPLLTQWVEQGKFQLMTKKLAKLMVGFDRNRLTGDELIKEMEQIIRTYVREDTPSEEEQTGDFDASMPRIVISETFIKNE